MATIVIDESMRQSIPIDDHFPKEALGLMFSDVYQQLIFDPFGELVDGYNQEFPLADCWGDRTQNVHPIGPTTTEKRAGLAVSRGGIAY